MHIRFSYYLNQIHTSRLQESGVKQAYLWATDDLKHSEMIANQHYKSLSSITRLDKHTQLTTGHSWHHEDPCLPVRIARG